MDESKGILFEKAYSQSLKEQFCYVDVDPTYGKRLFFENSGGSLRLKRCVELKAQMDAYPDCPERRHVRSKDLQEIIAQGKKDIMEVMFGARSGALLTELTASQTMFHMVEIIMENVAGSNAVVSCMEHPSAFDAVAYYCKKTGRELRVVPVNRQTGRIDPDAVAQLVDENTCLLSVMAASNIAGSIMDLPEIVRLARAKKPNLYIISDAVQHVPHCGVDVEALGLDGMNFAPYKFFGIRGCGFAYVSDRVAALPHRKLLAKEQSAFDLGTAAPANFAAASAIVDYVCDIGHHFVGDAPRKALYDEGMHRIHLQERALLHRMLEGTEQIPGLRHIPGVTVYVDTEDLTCRDLIAAMSIDGIDDAACTEEYQRRGVTVFERVQSSIYSARILESLGIEGAIRVSPLHCHDTDDIDRFLRITAQIAAEYAN